MRTQKTEGNEKTMIELRYEKNHGLERVYLGKHHVANIYGSEWSVNVHISMFQPIHSDNFGTFDDVPAARERLEGFMNRWFEDALMFSTGNIVHRMKEALEAVMRRDDDWEHGYRMGQDGFVPYPLHPDDHDMIRNVLNDLKETEK